MKKNNDKNESFNLFLRLSRISNVFIIAIIPLLMKIMLENNFPNYIIYAVVTLIIILCLIIIIPIINTSLKVEYKKIEQNKEDDIDWLKEKVGHDKNESLDLILSNLEELKKSNEKNKNSQLDEKIELLLNSINEIKEKDKTSEKSEENNVEDILGLMFTNMKRIGRYYEISQQHVTSSFVLACTTCIVGIVLLTASIILSFVIKDFNIAIIAAICGGITELFAGTALIVHKSSVKQLNYYYRALHENEQFLSTVNLVKEISADIKDEVYQNIISNSLEILKETALANNKEKQ